MKEQLIKRLKSLLWRVGAFAGVEALALIPLFQDILPIWAIAGLGLLAGELTKFLNNYLNRKA